MTEKEIKEASRQLLELRDNGCFESEDSLYTFYACCIELNLIKIVSKAKQLELINEKKERERL